MKRRGFATMLAIVSVGFVAAALVALSLHLSGQMLRTNSLKSSTQLEQLLLAGAADVSEHASHWQDAPTEGWTVLLPDELGRGGAVLTVQIPHRDADTVSVGITARVAGHEAQQTLKFGKISNLWQLQQAQLASLSQK